MVAQEVIIQNFRAKGGTQMESHPEPPLEVRRYPRLLLRSGLPEAFTGRLSPQELLWTCAMARLVFGPEMNIQVRSMLPMVYFPSSLHALGSDAFCAEAGACSLFCEPQPGALPPAAGAAEPPAR